MDSQHNSCASHIYIHELCWICSELVMNFMNIFTASMRSPWYKDVSFYFSRVAIIFSLFLKNTLIRKACKIKKAHILSPGDNIQICRPPPTLCLQNIKKWAFFPAYFPQKSSYLGFVETILIWPPRLPPPVSWRQNMSFFYFASIPNDNIISTPGSFSDDDPSRLDRLALANLRENKRARHSLSALHSARICLFGARQLEDRKWYADNTGIATRLKLEAQRRQFRLALVANCFL